jgi:hypothetical protein
MWKRPRQSSHPRRERLGISLAEIHLQSLGSRTFARALKQRGHVVGRGYITPAPRGGEGCVAVPGCHIEHLAAGAKIERFAQFLAHDLQGRADHGVVTRRPGTLLALLDHGEIGLCDRGLDKGYCR